MRGEHRVPGSVQLGRDHPRVRGEHVPSAPRPRRAGITPACAGSTSTCAHRVWSTRDHPRVRGEHLRSRSLRADTIADHPRVRGEHTPASPAPTGGGITPACAGSTRRRHALRPRGITPACAGSTYCCAWATASIGITPACAGSTRPVIAPSYTRRRDHPRVRGEHVTPRGSRHGHVRDHPRVRGEHAPRRSAAPIRRPDHPRVRGEHTVRGRVYTVPVWDHPRVRGEHRPA